MERTNPLLLSAFARVLRRHRKRLGLSQEELSFRTELSMSYISLLETTNRQPTLTVIHTLSRELNVPMGQLLSEVEDELANWPTQPTH